MATDTRDLEFYLNNPDQMPTDLGELEALIGGGGEGENESAEIGESGAASGAAGKEKSADRSGTNEETTEASTEESAQNAVLKSKDGKHEIPYSVLQTERDQRRAAEQAAEQLQRRLDAMEQQLKGQPAPQAQAAAGEPELSDADMEQIADDFPAIGKLLKGLNAKLGAVTQQLDDVRHGENLRRQGEATQASTSVQEAIDNNAQLSYWQQKDPEQFQHAVAFDNQIKADPRNKGLSLDQRFGKVVAAMEAVYGETQLPDEYRRAAPATPTPTRASPSNAAAVAQRAIDQARSAPVVRSLSDIPGGTPGESDEIAQLGQMSASDLGNKFMSMDPAKVMAILARAA